MCTAVVSCLGQRANAQAWTRDAGSVYTKLSRSHSSAGQRFEIDGTRVPYDANDTARSFVDESYYAYVEYGITRRTTAVVLLPYKQIAIRGGDPTQKANRLGSLEAGLRFGVTDLLGITDEMHRVSVGTAVTLPLGYPRDAAPAVGSGEIAFTALVAYGASLFPLPFYGQVAAGYRYRSGIFALSTRGGCDATRENCVGAESLRYDDEWLLRGEFGLVAGRWFLLQVIGHGAWSNSPPETDFDPANPIATRQRYSKLGGGLSVYPVPYLGVSIQVFGTPRGKNTIDSTDWFFGIEFLSDRR